MFHTYFFITNKEIRKKKNGKCYYKTTILVEINYLFPTKHIEYIDIL